MQRFWQLYPIWLNGKRDRGLLSIYAQRVDVRGGGRSSYTFKYCVSYAKKRRGVQTACTFANVLDGRPHISLFKDISGKWIICLLLIVDFICHIHWMEKTSPFHLINNI